ncbi:MAG: HD domain-containing protein, partial [Ferrovum sp.]|nr:HD domain-containing protein [Ferrovum sp.]NDU88250.1 HD domain-containing protein [Ferrovum sp.]
AGMIALWAIAPLHHPLNRCAVTGGALRRVLVEFIARSNNMLALRAHQRNLQDRVSWLAQEVEKATADILLREREIVLRLSRAAEFRDPETGSHILRMAHYSRHIARNLGLTEAVQKRLFEAAPMHDIGKLGVPDVILLKPGRLRPEEFEIMKMHAIHGYDILKNSASDVLQAGAEIALTHHEKFDGSGYPRGLSGTEIPLFGRIVAVADVFDALTTKRPYKEAWPMEKATGFIIENSGKHFDPACVNAFFKSWDKVLDIGLQFQDDYSFSIDEVVV